MHGLACAVFSVTASTSWSLFPSSSSTFLARFDILVVISMSSDSAKIPPLWWAEGLDRPKTRCVKCVPKCASVRVASSNIVY